MRTTGPYLWWSSMSLKGCRRAKSQYIYGRWLHAAKGGPGNWYRGSFKCFQIDLALITSCRIYQSTSLNIKRRTRSTHQDSNDCRREKPNPTLFRFWWDSRVHCLEKDAWRWNTDMKNNLEYDRLKHHLCYNPPANYVICNLLANGRSLYNVHTRVNCSPITLNTHRPTNLSFVSTGLASRL